jgi:FAD/FMN-containing dehydrogenase
VEQLQATFAVKNANSGTSPQTAVIIEYYGGAAGRVNAKATAFAHRQALYDFGILTRWSNPEESSSQIEWTRRFADAMRPYSSGAYLLSFLDQEPEETIRAAFGSNYERLAAVKKKYDPTNFFRVNQNIKPAG